MTQNKETIYSKDSANKKLSVVREFDAPVAQVWKAWTESRILDTWWAPRPWKANTKSMDFREGGVWLYYMQGPAGEKQFCRINFKKIVPNKSFTNEASFCDENGNVNNDFPVMYWKNEFIEAGKGTKVKIEITFATEADMEKIIEMGFKEGFSMGHQNLDEVLDASLQ